MWATIQGRLVAELRLAGITTIEAANDYLPGFLARLDARFGVPATDPEIAYRPLPVEFDLSRICCFKYGRVVGADNTIRFGGRVLQLGVGDRATEPGAGEGRGPRATRRKSAGPLAGRAGRHGGGPGRRLEAAGAVGTPARHRPPRSGGSPTISRPSAARSTAAARRSQADPSMASLDSQVTESLPSTGDRIAALRQPHTFRRADRAGRSVAPDSCAS
jgi:hypothetical protein